MVTPTASHAPKAHFVPAVRRSRPRAALARTLRRLGWVRACGASQARTRMRPRRLPAWPALKGSTASLARLRRCRVRLAAIRARRIWRAQLNAHRPTLASSRQLGASIKQRVPPAPLQLRADSARAARAPQALIRTALVRRAASRALVASSARLGLLRRSHATPAPFRMRPTLWQQPTARRVRPARSASLGLPCPYPAVPAARRMELATSFVPAVLLARTKIAVGPIYASTVAPASSAPRAVACSYQHRARLAPFWRLARVSLARMIVPCASQAPFVRAARLRRWCARQAALRPTQGWMCAISVPPAQDSRLTTRLDVSIASQAHSVHGARAQPFCVRRAHTRPPQT